VESAHRNSAPWSGRLECVTGCVTTGTDSEWTSGASTDEFALSTGWQVISSLLRVREEVIGATFGCCQAPVDGSEGFVGMRCPATRVLGQETVGWNFSASSPHRGATMDERDEDGRPVLRSHGIAITDHGVRIRVTREGGAVGQRRSVSSRARRM
jgi:hypothetical protein